MSSPETIDFAVLLKEFEGGNPAGVDLRLDEAHDSLMRRIKTYREASSAAERNNLKDPEKFSLASCKWDQVQQLCIEALSQHTKDFEIAAWLCESLVRDKGFPGLRDAFRLTRELAEKFWERLYPLPEGEDIAPRIRLLGGVFTGALLLPVKRISITADGCSFLDLDRSNRLQSISDAAERDRYIASGARQVPMSRHLPSSSSWFCRPRTTSIGISWKTCSSALTNSTSSTTFSPETAARTNRAANEHRRHRTLASCWKSVRRS